MSEASTPSLPDPEPLLVLSKALKARARSVDALVRVLEDPEPAKLVKLLTELEDGPDDGLGPHLQQVQAWLTDEKSGRATRLQSQLREACAAAGVELMILTRQPLELRIPPVSAVVDVDADRVDVRFARETIVRCGARADAILKARDEALTALERPLSKKKGAVAWDPAAFHRLLRSAWERAGGRGWIELTAVLPELSFVLQPRQFHQEPSARHFVPYSRARFAYDLWRLRRDRTLAVDGWRLSLGPATGGSTRDKKRVFWIEDDRGRGQYMLTLRFVPEGDAT